MIAPNIFFKFEYKSNILFVSTRFWNINNEYNLMTKYLDLNVSTFDIFASSNFIELYKYTDFIFKVIKHLIIKYKFKKIIFCGICKDCHLECLLVKKLYDDNFCDLEYHIVGTPLMMDLTKKIDMEQYSQMILSGMNDPQIKKYLEVRNIIDIAKDIPNLKLYSIIANRNNIDIKIEKDNIDPETGLPINDLKIYNISLSTEVNDKASHNFYYHSFKYNRNHNIIQPRLKYLIKKIINDNV